MSGYDLEEVLTQLGIGEAVVTVLSERGAPTPVAWTRLRAPQSRMAPADAGGADGGRRGLAADGRSTPSRWTASRRTSGWPPSCRSRRPAGAGRRAAGRHRRHRRRPRHPAEAPEKSTAEKVLESSAFKQMARSAAAVIGREITRSIFGTRRR